MELNKLSFTARHRSPWQIFDLTQLFVKQNYWPLLKIYLSMVVPFAALIFTFTPIQYAGIIVWWFKPLLERPLLDYLAKRSFSSNCTTWQAISSLRKLRFSTILLMLSWHRFSPHRAYLAAVDQLERQYGAKATKRKNLLTARCDAKQTWWMIFCVHIELVLVLAMFAAIYFFLPQGTHIDQAFLSESFENGFIEEVYFFNYIVAISLVAPYFTAGGFLMYLNSRIKLEAWDIELAFKQIVNKLSSSTLAIFLLFSLWLPTDYAFAEQTQTPAAVEQAQASRGEFSDTLRQQVANLYQEHELIEKQITWQPVSDEPEEFTMPEWFDTIIEFFKAVSAISPYIGYIMWIIVLLLVAWIIWIAFNHKLPWIMKDPQTIKKPTNQLNELPSFFSELKLDDWPDDLITASQKAMQDDNLRLALAYLLRHALICADQFYAIKLSKSMTENECQQALLATLPTRFHAVYRALFQYWIQLAWAHRPTEKKDIQQLLSQIAQLQWEESHEVA
ncbi:hypothetical protein C2869_19055 [Saccharobesus litoralis]|uniref:DUF4129 domain-containing protein n=1 Tax=Saccharobesus litoralis TaxID=2172099 RepID=A0A2S0VW18_9ALTE|nr:hypothetical protein [Saccharobesus litoralis]AWB68373.1 hypothetical protein C2869_19055 [Saccharobesus litoralis]